MKYGGRTEYDQVKAVVLKPKTPKFEIAAMAAMCAVRDPALAGKLLKILTLARRAFSDVLFFFSFEEETWDYVMTKARDQDLYQFFRSFWENALMRRFLINKFRENYGVLFKRLEGNFGLQYLIRVRTIFTQYLVGYIVDRGCYHSMRIWDFPLIKTGRRRRRSSR